MRVVKATLNLRIKGKFMKVKSIEEIHSVLQPIADGMEIEIVEVEFKQGREPALTVYIDTESAGNLRSPCTSTRKAALT